MTLEVLVQTGPGQPQKKVLSDCRLVGTSGENGNFGEIIRPYTLKGTKIFGTKAVVVNLDSFLTYLKEEFGLENYLIENILDFADERVASHFNKDMGYWSMFWDNASEVHHRDIMRLCYHALGEAVEKYSGYLDNDENLINNKVSTLEELNFLVGTIGKLKLVAKSITEALNKLYELKVTNGKCAERVELTKTAEKMLEYAQGYQLSSEEEMDQDRLWRSRITKVALDSAITKDQQKLRVLISYEEIRKNAEYFAGCLSSVEIATNVIEVPYTHHLEPEDKPIQPLPVSSTIILIKTRDGYRTEVKQKALMPHYSD